MRNTSEKKHIQFIIWFLPRGRLMVIKFCSTIVILNVEVIAITWLHIRFENKIIPCSGSLPNFNSSYHILCPLRCDVINLKIHFTPAMMPFIKLTLHILCILSLGNIRLSTPFLSLTFWKNFPPKFFFLDIILLIFLWISSCTAFMYLWG